VILSPRPGEIPRTSLREGRARRAQTSCAGDHCLDVREDVAGGSVEWRLVSRSVTGRGVCGTLQHERAARNEALFREINDRLAQLNDALDEHSPYGTWMRECQDTDCHEPVSTTQ
jgi:hypothetical protein